MAVRGEISDEMNGTGRMRFETDLRKECLSYLALAVLWRFTPCQCCKSPQPIYTSAGQHERLLAMEHATALLVGVKGVTTKPMTGCLLYMEAYFPCIVYGLRRSCETVGELAHAGRKKFPHELWLRFKRLEVVVKSEDGIVRMNWI